VLGVKDGDKLLTEQFVLLSLVVTQPQVGNQPPDQIAVPQWNEQVGFVFLRVHTERPL
jgi:hypothetical protein